MTTKDALDFLSAQLDLHLLPNTLRKKIGVDRELQIIRGISMEKEGVECGSEAIRAYFELLTRNVSGVPAAFVFNLDESGFQDWANRCERSVTVPAACGADVIGIPVDHSMKRSSLLVCIPAHETWLKPMLILPRKMIEKELLQQGINDRLSQFVYQGSGFITGDLFREWCAQVLFPETNTGKGDTTTGNTRCS
jgi:hypothetical protein